MRINQFIKQNNWCDTTILMVFILAFAGATYNHVLDIVRGGLFPYTKWCDAPEIINFYWTGLTLLDPLAVILLQFNVRAGYILALGIMLTDVPINIYAGKHFWQLPFFQNHALLMQTAFLIFLLLTVGRIWKLSRYDPSG